MKMRSKIVLATAALGVLLSATSARAITWAAEPSLVGIIGAASLAFEGTVEHIEYGASPPSEGGVLPYTAVTFRVGRAWAGTKAGETVRVLNVGGRIPGFEHRYWSIPGLPFYRPGERVIVFANDSMQPFAGALFGEHGVLRVVEEGAGSVVLSHAWRPLTRSPGGDLGPVASLRCRVGGDERTRCESWEAVHPPREQEGFFEAKEPCDDFVTLGDLDAAIARVRVGANVQEGPMSGVAGHDDEFGDALRKVLEMNRSLFDGIRSVLASQDDAGHGVDKKEK